MRDLKFRYLWLTIGCAMVLFVIYETLTPNPVEMDVAYSDKLMHTLGYFILMGWFIQLFQQKKILLMLGVFFIAMGIGLEFLQKAGGVRYFEINDMIANASGVVLATLLLKTPLAEALLWFEKRVLHAF